MGSVRWDPYRANSSPFARMPCPEALFRGTGSACAVTMTTAVALRLISTLAPYGKILSTPFIHDSTSNTSNASCRAPSRRAAPNERGAFPCRIRLQRKKSRSGLS